MKRDTSLTPLVRRLYNSRLSAFLPWLICSFAALFYFYELCLRVALGTMVPEVRSALHISFGQIGMLSAFYYYSYTPTQIFAGALMDRLGPRNLLISMVLLCSVGSFLFAHTALYPVAELAQFCIGFASAFAFVGVLKLANSWLPVKYFSLVSGVTTSLGMAGAMGSNILITHIMQTTGWRGVWYIFSAFGLILAGVFFLLCVNQPRSVSKRRVHQQGKILPWWTIRQDFVLMIKSSYFWINAIIGGLLYFPTTSFASLWGIPYLRTAYHIDKVAASTTISMVFLGWAVGSPIVGWLSERMVTKKTLLILGALLAFLMMTLVISPINLKPAQLVVVLFLFGIFSSVEVLVFDVAARLFRGGSAATAASMTNFILMLVCTLLQPVIGFSLHDNPTVHQYRIAMLIIPVGLLGAMLLALFIYKECDYSYDQ